MYVAASARYEIAYSGSVKSAGQLGGPELHGERSSIQMRETCPSRVLEGTCMQGSGGLKGNYMRRPVTIDSVSKLQEKGG